MALFLADTGDLELAFPILEEAIASYRELHDKFHLADVLAAYGHGELLRGNHRAARTATVEALGLMREAENWSGVGLMLEIMAIVELSQGRYENAVRLFGSAEEIRLELEGGYPFAASELLGFDVIGDARRAIGDEAVDRAMAEGRSMSRAEAVAHATELG